MYNRSIASRIIGYAMVLLVVWMIGNTLAPVSSFADGHKPEPPIGTDTLSEPDTMTSANYEDSELDTWDLLLIMAGQLVL